MEGSDAFATNTFPPIFSAATRRMVVASEGHIVALAEAFLARRCEFLSFGGVFQDSTTQNPTRSPTAIHRALNVTRETGCIRGSGSAVMLYLVSKELMKLLAMTPYVSTLGTTWLAALCALSIGVELGAPRRPFAPGAVAALARAMSKMSLEAGDAGLFEPLVRLAPHLSPFVVGRIVLDRTCRLLSWAHCLQLLPYTLCGSTAQRVLLRRIMSAHHVGFLPSVCHFLSSAALPTKLFSHSAPAYQTDLRTLLLLAERNWQRALWTYQHADDRTQRACAHHVARLVLYAEAWLPRARVHSGDSRALTGRCQFETLFINALRSSEGDRVAEDVLQFCLQRGLWAGGLAFHHAIREADPNLLEANRKIETYTSLLCKGLINHTTLAHTIVDVTRFARMARWSEACAAFVQYSFGDSENTKLCSTAPSHPSSCGYWPTILSVDMPRQLSHLAHTVRYSALCCADIWERALEWVPASSLPLPLHHELLLSQRVGRPTNPTRPISIITNGGAPAPATELPVPLSMSLVQVAMREKLHRVSEPETRASFATVERTLRALRHRGQWEQAVLVCEHALARRCFPHSASAVVVAACLPSWKAAVRCYLHLSQRMRPDTATTALALEACEHGGQWTLSLRILQQCMLTYPRGSAAVAAPRIIDSAVRAALRSGAWVAALPIVRQCRHTHNSCLANTILQTYMQAQQYDDAVNFFYDCVRRGVRPLDESLALVIKASEAVSAEYRDVARFAGVIASTLEDFCHVHGMLLEHVLVVCRGMSSCPRVTVVALAHGHEFTYVRTGALCHRGSAGFSN
ncbi:hypothetical protein ERJ75_001595200 [Trypanosoma vivax]|nr:hypothetical protein ERJ75_001595200 [Trypanosoma vivax]